MRVDSYLWVGTDDVRTWDMIIYYIMALISKRLITALMLILEKIFVRNNSHLSDKSENIV